MNCTFPFGLFLIGSSLAYSNDIAVVSLAIGTEYRKSVEKGIENKRIYCKMHGYDFICGEENLDPSRSIPWSKILQIRKVMENSTYKWIFWTDADSLIMNLGVRLEDFIDDSYNLIIGKDFNEINTGQFFLKNSPWSLQLLSDIYAHTECIDHPWWEQAALILEIQQNPELINLIKIVSQRLFNSYPPEIACSFLTASYQIGDFILHFPGVRNTNLSDLFYKYHKNVIDRPEYSNLDLYLKKSGFQLSPIHSNLNEGYMTESQKKQFTAHLQLKPHIKKIAEIGLNGGHSAENFFQNCPELEQFISFDIQQYAYTRVAREFLERKYKDRFIFIPGDSHITVREYIQSSLETKCDLIYIDGSHNYENVIQDILNCNLLANTNSTLWVDDYNGEAIRNAIHECVKRGIIRINNIHHSSDPCGNRTWIEASYTICEK